jgi:hypothetical protein
MVRYERKAFGKISFPFEIQLMFQITQPFERFVHGESAIGTAAAQIFFCVATAFDLHGIF